MSKTLNDIFPSWITAGIFATLNTKNVPWSDDVTGHELDILYHGARSGDKLITPFITRMLDDEGELTDTNVGLICDALVTLYGNSWNKLYNVMSLSYNPISNYDMTESETSNGTVDTTHTGTDTTLRTGTDTLSQTGTDTVAKTGTDNHSTSSVVDNDATTTNSVYGFNSSSAVPSDAHSGTTDSTTTGTDNETVNLTDTQTKNLQDARTLNLSDANTKNLSDNSSSESERTLTRSGNIGVTTSQQMVESEINLWQWKFFEQVFRDLDNVLTLAIY